MKADPISFTAATAAGKAERTIFKVSHEFLQGNAGFGLLPVNSLLVVHIFHVHSYAILISRPKCYNLPLNLRLERYPKHFSRNGRDTRNAHECSMHILV